MTNLPYFPAKTCRKCNKEKKITDFARRKINKDGRYSYCKQCVKIINQKSYESKRVLSVISDLPGEIWREVVGFDGLYMASNVGRVKRMAVRVHHSKNGFIQTKERLLTQNKSRYGYRKVILSKRNKHLVQQVHLLVWDAFGEKKRDGFKLVVDHIDNNKENNCFSNLQCVTHRVNTTKDRKRKSGFVGVYWHQKTKKWQAKISFNRKAKSLGLYIEKEDAAAAYLNALKSLPS